MMRLGTSIVLACAVVLLAQAAAWGAPVFLNEYNAVMPDRWLEADGNASTKSDTFFGRVMGNGGDWFEMVVVGDGTAGSNVDMRGWKLEIEDNAGATFNPSDTVVLSNDPYWSNVRAGTILTIIENDTDAGGLDTGILRVNNRSTLGYAWTNIWLGDTTYIDQAASNYGGGIAISNTDTQFRIVGADGNVVFGPAGEGISPASGVGSRDVLKLEADPSVSITANSASYNNGTSSTFGSPNIWGGGSITQDFTAFIPEPGTMGLLALGCTCLLRRRST